MFSALVSPTWLAIACLMTLVPLHRLVTPYWPAPVFDFILPDGSIVLGVDRDRPPRPGGVLRTRPLNAARIERSNGRFELGYVTVVRSADEAPGPPPDGMVWQPPGPDCELAVRTSSESLAWIPCSDVVEISLPNRMRFGAKLRLALQQSVPFWRIQP